ncbi:ISPsy25, transposase, partial [Pseudomonas syringae pv. actinidiae ICMP 19096]
KLNHHISGTAKCPAQPTRYVWNAKGEDILNKIQRARAAMTTQALEKLILRQYTSELNM